MTPAFAYLRVSGLAQVDGITLKQLPTMPDPCWEWNRHRDQDGYGRLKVSGKVVSVHRLIYMLFVGRLYDMQLVIHTCDNPPCCNPAHLRKGTPRDNIEDCCRKHRNAFGKKNHHAKLSDGLVVQIRREYSSGYSSVKLAKKYGIATSTMQSVIFGRTWRHVPDPCTPRAAGRGL